MADIVLNADGLEAVRDHMFQQVFNGRHYQNAQGQEEAVTPEVLHQRDISDLFVELARQSGFPRPALTGNPAPIAYQVPTELPEGMEIPQGTYGQHIAAADFLFTGQNRRIGKTSHTSYGADKGSGNRPFTVISEEVLDNMLSWVNNNIPRDALMTLPPVSTRDASSYLTPSNRYQDSSGEMKAAFLEGMGTTRDSATEHGFLDLFRETLTEVGAAPAAGSARGLKPGLPRLELGEQSATLSGLTVRAMNPEVIAELQKEGGARVGAQIKTDVTRLGQRILSAFDSGKIKAETMLTPEDVFQIGYALRESGILEQHSTALGARLGVQLGERPVLPDEMLNQLVTLDERKMPPDLSRQVGNVQVDIHHRSTEAGERMAVQLTEGESTQRLRLTLPQGQMPDIFMAQVEQTLGAGQQGSHEIVQAMRTAAAERLR